MYFQLGRKKIAKGHFQYNKEVSLEAVLLVNRASRVNPTVGGLVRRPGPGATTTLLRLLSSPKTSQEPQGEIALAIQSRKVDMCLRRAATVASFVLASSLALFLYLTPKYVMRDARCPTGRGSNHSVSKLLSIQSFSNHVADLA